MTLAGHIPWPQHTAYVRFYQVPRATHCSGTKVSSTSSKLPHSPRQQHSHLIGQMTGLQDPNRMANLRLGADQVARRVNDISKANLRDDWEFGKPPYSRANPAPMVSPWSPYFVAAHLLIRPDATREVLLNAICHP